MKKIPIRQLISPQQELPTTECFKIRKVEDILGDHDLMHDLHRHDFFFILALKKGKGRHEIDFIEYKVLDNSLFIIRPGQVHQLELNASCTGYLVEFNNEFYHPKDKSSNLRLRNCMPYYLLCLRKTLPGKKGTRMLLNQALIFSLLNLYDKALTQKRNQ